MEIEGIEGRRESLVARLHELEDGRYEIRVDDPANPEFWLSIRLRVSDVLKGGCNADAQEQW